MASTSASEYSPSLSKVKLLTKTPLRLATRALTLASSPAPPRNFDASCSIEGSRFRSTVSEALAASLSQSNCRRPLGCWAAASVAIKKNVASLVMDSLPIELIYPLLGDLELAFRDAEGEQELPL